ncbi:MAG: cysteine methyltransferase, partial [Baekduiaceae bacterium]
MTELQPPAVDAAALAARFAARAAESGDADVAYAVVDTPAGRVVAARTPTGLVRLAYEDFNGGLDQVLE